MAQFSSVPNSLSSSFSGEEFLEIKNIVKAYPKADGGNFVVLDGVNLTIGSQEYISVIGHSGCGKSTLLKIIAGLEQASSGQVTLEGKLAVDEVLKSASKVEKNSLVNEHLAMVHLTAAADKYPEEISGGMKQRVGIARALVTRPKMLLMDEPFGALDALTKRKLQQEVLKIWESHRQAVIMITHDVDEAIFMSDRIVLMTNGPHANIGEILTVPFPHPRDRHAMRETQEYYDLRNHALDFLERYFTADE